MVPKAANCIYKISLCMQEQMLEGECQVPLLRALVSAPYYGRLECHRLTAPVGLVTVRVAAIHCESMTP